MPSVDHATLKYCPIVKVFIQPNSRHKARPSRVQASVKKIGLGYFTPALFKKASKWGHAQDSYTLIKRISSSMSAQTQADFKEWGQEHGHAQLQTHFTESSLKDQVLSGSVYSIRPKASPIKTSGPLPSHCCSHLEGWLPPSSAAEETTCRR